MGGTNGSVPKHEKASCQSYRKHQDEGLIGRDNDREEIIKLLMQPHSHGDSVGNKSICVIPIVGIGGLGKTTLSKLVFNDKRMDELFQLKMWVCISGDFDIWQIIIKIVNYASVPTISLAQHEIINNLDIDQLQSHSDISFLAFQWIIVYLFLSNGHLRKAKKNIQKLENIARQYIDELHSRSFLEDFEDLGHLYYFKVHDLVHDLALYVAKEELLAVNSCTRNIPEQIRHLSVVENHSLSHALFHKSRRVKIFSHQWNGN
ncbi:putative disease resistance protein RGA3 [Glycine max]|nr:putative disease resistance protein RGA3 [Glycine max]